MSNNLNSTLQATTIWKRWSNDTNETEEKCNENWTWETKTDPAQNKSWDQLEVSSIIMSGCINIMIKLFYVYHICILFNEFVSMFNL